MLASGYVELCPYGLMVEQNADSRLSNFYSSSDVTGTNTTGATCPLLAIVVCSCWICFAAVSSVRGLLSYQLLLAHDIRSLVI